jgi:23S rRNA (adenine2503-C2)-methyltransferase
METAKPVLSGLSSDGLLKLLEPLPRFRSVQIFKWIARGVSRFSDMSDLPVNLRDELDARFSIRTATVSRQLNGADGTVKLGITLHDGANIEAVLLSDKKNRKTACLSTQAGCPAGCVFCKTGSLGFSRNLSSAEIVEQFLLLREAGGSVSNIVVMGMGEPLLNLAELRQALAALCDRQGLNISKRRVTVSTCGIIEGIIDLADTGPDIRLALSLVTADEQLRGDLMPISRHYKLSRLKDALVYYQNRQGGRITLELVLLGGINTRPQDASALADFAAGLNTVVNLILWNSFTGAPKFKPALRNPGGMEVREFKKMLESGGLKTTCRLSKGGAVSGACGQLGGSFTVK